MRCVAFLFLCATAGFVSSSPLKSSRAAHRPRDSSISNQDLLNFKYYAQWAGAAYCNDDASSGASVVCPDNVCPELQSNKATIIGSFSDDTLTSMEGFVGVDPVRSEVVVSFRGTHSAGNWLANLDFGVEACDDLPVAADSDCKVHSGFNTAWAAVKGSMYSFLADSQLAYPNYTVVVTGHSLGAAVGTIAAAHLRAGGVPCALYTFGSPRVGNQGFVDLVQGQEGTNYRVTHLDDPVPRVPPSWDVMGAYRHLSPEYWLTVGNETVVSPSAVTVSNFKVCEGANNDACNAGTDGMDIDAHRWYFRNISSCSPS